MVFVSGSHCRFHSVGAPYNAALPSFWQNTSAFSSGHLFPHLVNDVEEEETKHHTHTTHKRRRCIRLCYVVHMDRLAGNYLSNGDVANASSLYNSLEKLNPVKYSRMARICRVLCNPQSVPLPFRYDDICDALLDPSVPPEVLLRSSTEDVQKSFQRLAVCVHPDKNPNARAKDAFLRLTYMKDKALQLLRDRAGAGDEGVAAAVQQHNGKAAEAAGVRRPPRPPLAGLGSNNGHSTGAAAGKRRPAKHVTPPLTPVTELQAVSSVSTGLDQLRHTTIKLGCFTRRDIADDFEIFSGAQRVGQRSAYGSSETSLAECGEEQLAATVPVMPCGKKPPPLNCRRQPPLQTSERQTSTSSPVLVTPLSQPSSADPPPASPTLPSAASSVQSPVVLLRPPPPPLSALPRIGETEAEDVTTTASPRVAAAAVASHNAIREQIDQTCQRLQEMRTQNTNIRLTLDLSFEAYQRSKQNS
jgi:hypothetical protein